MKTFVIGFVFRSKKPFVVNENMIWYSVIVIAARVRYK